MRKLALIVAIGMFSSSLYANTQTQQDPIEEMFVAMDAESTMDVIYQQMGSVFERIQQQMNISKDEAFIFEKYNAQMIEIMRTEMSWDKMKPDMINLYKQNFTSEEIQAITDFYNSPAGRSFTQKMPVIAQESMMIGQQMAMQAMPAIQEVSKALQAELTEYRAQKNK